jgi:GNAT superfamily N-acetyltransferase
VARLEIRSLGEDLLDDAGRLLAERHRVQRRREPALDEAFEDPMVARQAIARLLSADSVTSLAALRGGELVGYLVAASRDPDRWGPNVWIEGAGHAAPDGEVVRRLYAAASGDWVAAGRPLHYVIVPASDEVLLDAWSSMGFGRQHVHGLRDVPGNDFNPAVPGGLVIRTAGMDDLAALASLGLVLATHQVAAPVFSRAPVPTFEETLAELEAEGVDDPRFATFVAEYGGRVVGSAVGCAIDESPEHAGIVRPPGAGFLGFAAVLPDVRGMGVGRALGETVLAWARDAGHATIVADWRSTNVESNRTWLALGFRPIFHRLHRAIG